MNINKISVTKSSVFSGIEIKSATFVDKKFPFHFHQNWSLAYIEMGSENMGFNEIDFLLNKNAYILIPPYSLHKNWGNKNNSWTYKAIYIENDKIKDLAKKLNLDYSFLANCPYFISYSNQDFQVSNTFIINILEKLFLSQTVNSKKLSLASTTDFNFERITEYLKNNVQAKVTLESLEKEFKINKFKLLKKFKKDIGLTPIEYQMALRIEMSKQLFYNDMPLTHIALESGFYDQSHFTHSFKKFVGVTPGVYKSNSNILQDQQLSIK